MKQTTAQGKSGIAESVERARPHAAQGMRLNQFLAAGGVGSRRDCDGIIRTGRVKINGVPVSDMGTRVQPGDVIKVGRRVIRPLRTVTLAINKPRGVLTTCEDPGKRKTVLALIPPGLGRLFPVGRLDMESEGLLLLTNDGALSQQLAHPSHGVEKEYIVTLATPFDLAKKPKLLRGFQIEGGHARMEAAHFHSPQCASIVLRQGIKRQIRLMFHELGCEVKRLKRVRIGGLKLGSLPAGSWRELTPSQITQLMRARSPVERRPHAKQGKPKG